MRLGRAWSGCGGLLHIPRQKPGANHQRPPHACRPADIFSEPTIMTRGPVMNGILSCLQTSGWAWKTTRGIGRMLGSTWNAARPLHLTVAVKQVLSFALFTSGGRAGTELAQSHLLGSGTAGIRAQRSPSPSLLFHTGPSTLAGYFSGR